MMSSRLETAIDMNFIQFNYENDKKKRENEVIVFLSNILWNDHLKIESELKINSMISGERRVAKVKQIVAGSIERNQFITIGCG